MRADGGRTVWPRSRTARPCFRARGGFAGCGGRERLSGVRQSAAAVRTGSGPGLHGPGPLAAGLGQGRAAGQQSHCPAAVQLPRWLGPLRTAGPVHLSEYRQPEPGTQHTAVRALLPEDPAHPVALERNLNRRAETFGHVADLSVERITWVGVPCSFRVCGQGRSGHRTEAPVRSRFTEAPERCLLCDLRGLASRLVPGSGG